MLFQLPRKFEEIAEEIDRKSSSSVSPGTKVVCTSSYKKEAFMNCCILIIAVYEAFSVRCGAMETRSCYRSSLAKHAVFFLLFGLPATTIMPYCSAFSRIFFFAWNFAQLSTLVFKTFYWNIRLELFFTFAQKFQRALGWCRIFHFFPLELSAEGKKLQATFTIVINIELCCFDRAEKECYVSTGYHKLAKAKQV